MKNQMNINLNNYEAYFLDYHEGNLSLDLVKELMEFIKLHPELREEFESFEPIGITDSGKIVYDEKAILKKNVKGIDASNFDEYAIAHVEGTLSSSSQQELKAFIAKNPAYQKELELYFKTKIIPDTSIVFDDKPALKKEKRRPAAFYYWSAAASVALLVGMYIVFSKNEKSNGNGVVNTSIKDSNRVANHVVKSVDTVIVAPKVSPANSPINRLNNVPAFVKVRHIKKSKNERTIPNDGSKDSSDVVINKHPFTPVKKQAPLPSNAHGDNDSVAFNANVPDTAAGVPLIIINTPQPAVAAAPRKKKRNFLVALVTLTCKGLHKLTGKHIELEKHFAADTNTIVAYQLDLGNKKFQFPVKE